MIADCADIPNAIFIATDNSETTWDRSSDAHAGCFETEDFE